MPSCTYASVEARQRQLSQVGGFMDDALSGDDLDEPEEHRFAHPFADDPEHALVHVDYFKHQWHLTSQDDWESRLHMTWKLFTKRSHTIINCRRLENLSWRVWVQEKFNLSKLDPALLNWSKEDCSAGLWGPAFSSQVKLHSFIDVDTRNRVSSRSMTRSKSVSDLAAQMRIAEAVGSSFLAKSTLRRDKRRTAKPSTNNLFSMIEHSTAKRQLEDIIDNSKVKRSTGKTFESNHQKRKSRKDDVVFELYDRLSDDE